MLDFNRCFVFCRYATILCFSKGLVNSCKHLIILLFYMIRSLYLLIQPGCYIIILIPNQINLFHATSLFLYPLKTSEIFFDIFMGYKKKPVA